MKTNVAAQEVELEESGIIEDCGGDKKAMGQSLDVMPVNSEVIFTDEAAAKYLTVSTQTLKLYRSKGIGPDYSKIGARIVYKKAYLDEYLEVTRVRLNQLKVFVSDGNTPDKCIPKTELSEIGAADYEELTQNMLKSMLGGPSLLETAKD